MESAPQLRKVLNVLPHGKEYTVIANLPKNSVSLATQAEQAGVDAIMFNVDGEDTSCPGHFGSYDLHDVYINDALSSVSVPCGIGIGAAKVLTEEYWERIMSTPFSFVEMYAHQMPLYVMSDPRLKKIIAITTGYILEQVKELFVWKAWRRSTWRSSLPRREGTRSPPWTTPHSSSFRIFGQTAAAEDPEEDDGVGHLEVGEARSQGASH